MNVMRQNCFKKNSGEIARKRLKHLLTADRGGLFAGTSGSDSRRFPEERVTLSGD